MSNGTLYCPLCYSINLTQENLDPRLIALGLYKCMNVTPLHPVGRLVRPITLAMAQAMQEAEATQPEA